MNDYIEKRVCNENLDRMDLQFEAYAMTMETAVPYQQMIRDLIILNPDFGKFQQKAVNGGEPRCKAKEFTKWVNERIEMLDLRIKMTNKAGTPYCVRSPLAIEVAGSVR